MVDVAHSGLMAMVAKRTGISRSIDGVTGFRCFGCHFGTPTTTARATGAGGNVSRIEAFLRRLA
jgi:hypothetical protein